MKALTLKIVLIALGTFLFSSCTTMLYTSLDVLRPAKVAFAADAKNVLIVNNTVVQPPEVGHITHLMGENARNILMQTDSLSIFCLGALTEELNSKNFFTTVGLIPNSKNNSNNFNQISYLTSDTIAKNCISNQADVIIALNKIKVKDELSEFYLTETGTYLSTLDIKYETSWSIHYPNKPALLSFEFKDTVYWEAESYFRKKSMSDLPKRDDALIDGALYVGQKTVNRFVPYWEKADRYFFKSNNKYIKKGIDSIYVKNWNSAITNWRIALNSSKNSLTHAYAANNMAVAYEILGDIDKALEYASQSYYFMGKLSFVNYDTYFKLSQYINELTQRKSEIAKLKLQLAE